MKPIIISDWGKGIGESSLTGFGNMQGCSVDTIPGVLMVNGLTAEQSDLVVGNTRVCYWIRQDPATGNFYALMSDGTVLKQVWGATTWTDISHGASTTNAHGNGLGVWKGYLVVARDTLIDFLLMSSDTWTTGTTPFTTDNTGPTNDANHTWHPMVSGQDDILYIGHTRYIGSLKEIAGTDFLATNLAGTCTGTQKALDLPEGHFTRCMAELGKNLMIGTETSAGDKVEGGDIFPWDRISQSSSLPIRTEELGIRSMLSHNGMLYFFAGLKGQLYITDGSRVVKLRKIPEQILGIAGGQWIDVYPDAMTWHKNRLFFGISVNNTNASDGYGVWSYDNGRLVLEHITSGGFTGGKTIYVSCVNAFTEDRIKIGWYNSTDAAAGIDEVSASARYGSYTAFAESKFYDVAYKFERQIIRILEVRLAKALASGEGVRIKYREKMGDSWTTLATFTDAVHIHRADIGLDVLTIQLRIELTTDGAGGNSNGSPQVVSVILR